MTPRPAAPPRSLQDIPHTTRARRSLDVPAVALIAAVASNGVIGTDNRLPWRLSADLMRFRALTVGHTVIMGRKTWESLSRALPDRQNIVVTRQRGYAAAGTETAGSFDEALMLVRLPEPAFCIGGGELYRDALPYAAMLYLTEIERDFEGDAHFPVLRDGDWRQTAREAHTVDGSGGFDYAFVTYERIARPD